MSGSTTESHTYDAREPTSTPQRLEPPRPATSRLEGVADAPPPPAVGEVGGEVPLSSSSLAAVLAGGGGGLGSSSAASAGTAAKAPIAEKAARPLPTCRSMATKSSGALLAPSPNDALTRLTHGPTLRPACTHVTIVLLVPLSKPRQQPTSA